MIGGVLKIVIVNIVLNSNDNYFNMSFLYLILIGLSIELIVISNSINKISIKRIFYYGITTFIFISIFATPFYFKVII